MTCIVYGVKTKKELREQLKLLESGQGMTKVVTFSDPAIISAYQGGATFGPADLAIGDNIVVTNHPKRSWFASITRTGERKWRVS